MKRYILGLTVLALSIGLTAIAWAQPPIGVGPEGPPIFPGRSEIAKPPMPTRDSTGWRYGGTVTEVTKDSITIVWWGEKVPKKFVASEILASGKFPIWRRRLDGPPDSLTESYRYRLADVKVGDHVDIDFAHLNGVDICDGIHIRKRPGGRVPPLPEGAENLKLPPGLPPEFAKSFILIPYHERVNAYWDLEDKGIPYPEKFGSSRRWPVAPMPREVKVGPAVVP